MDFVKLSEQRFTAKKFDVNKKIPRDDVEKLTTNSSTPFSIRKSKTAALPTKKLPKNASNPENSLLICVNVPAKLSTGKLSRPISQ